MPPETSTEPLPALTRKVFEPVETQFTPGERSMVAWISTDCVDHERDVVVSSGVDYKSYFLGKTPESGNPCVLAFHDFGRWPLGRCDWIKIKQSREFNGLYAKTVFDDDPEAETVWRKIKAGSLRGISIGFRPPDDLKPGEWGPPTREELLRRPDWNGAERVIRRCVLLEYSVCSLPMNPQALVAAVNKGIHRPVFSIPQPQPQPQPQSQLEPESREPLATTPDERERQAEPAESKAVAVDGGPTDAGATIPPSALPEAAAVGDPAANEGGSESGSGLVRPLDHVRVRASHYDGVGRVETLHVRGHVPDVAEDMIGTAEQPAARIRCYKRMGDGHVPTRDFIAARAADLVKLDEPLQPPSKSRSDAPSRKANRSRPDAPLPPLPQVLVKSDQEVRADLIAKLNDMLSPEGFRRIAREEAERAAGFV